MADLILRATGKKLTVENEIELVSGEANATNCIFTYDSEWEGFTKTVVFYSNPGQKKYIVLKEDICKIPWEALSADGTLYIGLFGVKDNQILPTNYVTHNVDEGPNPQIEPLPTEDIYLQIANIMQQQYVDAVTATEMASAASQSAESALLSEAYSANSEINSKASEMASKESETNAKLSETNAKNSETSAAANAQTTIDKVGIATTKAAEAVTSANNAYQSELNAKTSETNSKASETASKTSETNAKASETAAKTSETNSKASETAAKSSETNAKTSETNAKTSETNAKTSETEAKAARDQAVATTQSKLGINNNSISDIETWASSKINAQLASTATYYNVKKFGAKGDGVTDDTVAIQLAITTAEANNGGIILFPDGKFIISAPLLIVGHNYNDGINVGSIYLKGSGVRTTEIKATHAGDAIRKTGTYFCGFSDFYLNGAGKSVSGSIGINLIGTGGSDSFNNILIRNFSEGITQDDITAITANSLFIRDCGKGFASGYQGDVYNFIGCRFEYCNNGIYLGKRITGHETGSLEENCATFLGCIISHNDEGITIPDYGGSQILFSGCYFEGNVKEGTIGDSSFVTGVKGITFEHCYYDLYASATQGYLCYGDIYLTARDIKASYRTTSYGALFDIRAGNASCEFDLFMSNQATQIKYLSRSYYLNIGSNKLMLNKVLSMFSAPAYAAGLEPLIKLTETDANSKKIMSFERATASTGVVGNAIYIAWDSAGKGRLYGMDAYNQLPPQSGTTASRPTLGTGVTYPYQQYFDTTLNKLIMVNTLNNGWIDAMGTAV